MTNTSTASAYQYCLQQAQQHYENFPVASRILPARLRQPISAIYAYARQADDYADEGKLRPQQRIELLTAHGQALDDALAGKHATNPVFIACADAIRRHNLDPQLFHDLLIAFKLDVEKKCYDTFKEVLDYCRYSANPIGRLLLQLEGIRDHDAIAISDAVCSALQLINFYQDLAQDYDENQRVYLAMDEMQAAGITTDDLKHRRENENIKQFMLTQYHRAEAMLHAGNSLPAIIGGRMGIELRIVLLTAQRILERLKHQENVFSRPRLRKRDWLIVLFQLVFKPNLK